MSDGVDARAVESYLREQSWNDSKATILGRVDKVRETCLALQRSISEAQVLLDLSVILASAVAIQADVQKLTFAITADLTQADKIRRILRERVSNLHGYAAFIPEYFEGLAADQAQELQRIQADGREFLQPALDSLLHPIKWAPPRSEESGAISRRDGRILVVDNDPGVLKIYIDFLKGQGHHPRAVKDGHEALQILRGGEPFPYELILLDLRMTVVDGLDILRELGRDRAKRGIPVLVTTDPDLINDPNAHEALKLGAVDVVPKLIDPFFVARVENCLVHFRLDQEYRNLLGRVLPPSIVEQYLREKQGGISKKIPYAAVLFVDLCGFTSYSAKNEPGVVVRHLERVFEDWDRIAERHGVQKIKTIGDGFMAVAEIPDGRDPDDPAARGDLVQQCVECGLEMLRRLRLEPSIYPPDWDLRVGINGGGPVVAGLLGRHRFLYDVWGAAVNKASRMESHGKKGRVNLSEEAYDVVRGRYEGWDDLEADPILLKGLEAEGEALIFGLRPDRAVKRPAAGPPPVDGAAG